MREMKKYHLAHHYKNFELGYGVTSESSRAILCRYFVSNYVQVRYGIMSSGPF